MDPVPVEVAAGAVIVLGRARVGVAGQDLRIAQRDAGVEALVMAACRSEWGLMCRGMPAAFVMRPTMR